ncbi:metal ABC transporter solute-binding protein, Zn/Mn family [Candidatus Nitrosotenuis aquarius]|uniref:metal ABC transporter solute-binding protein, Zn/Mn family n=1 Tax=Candidatus Nitrosotenuis aquarius TaxID=1846278 RepID=UPI0013C34C67|nr:zinc ABC transporter substrate-binding protein [Candidatus Nitrosotenuis aquarius]
MKKPIIAAIGVGVAIVIGVILVGTQQSMLTPQSDLSRQDTMLSEPQASKIKIIASFYPLYEFSKNIVGDRAEISTFTPIGIEPHDWEPSTGDLVALKESDIFVYNGGGMEPFVDKLIDSGEYSNVLFVETVHGIDLIETESHDEDHAEEEHTEGSTEHIDDEHANDENESHAHEFPYDPHVWLDPILAKEQVMIIKDALIKVDADNAQHYEDNANAYSAKLDELDSKIKTELSSCNKDTIVPFHNAFSYFGNRYGIKIHALSGLAPESEATASDLKELIDFVKENQIKIIFAEELVDPKLAKVLADEAGAQVLVLSPLEGITAEEQANGTSYIEKMEENLKNIKVALECQ